jgi:hypothetical protein
MKMRRRDDIAFDKGILSSATRKPALFSMGRVTIPAGREGSLTACSIVEFLLVAIVPARLSPTIEGHRPNLTE